MDGVLVCFEVKESEQALAEGGDYGTVEVDLAIQGHEELHGLKLAIVGGKGTTLVDELVGEIFDGVAENLQRVTGFRVDAAPPFEAILNGIDGRRRDRQGECGGCRGCHGIYPHLLSRLVWQLFSDNESTVSQKRIRNDCVSK